MKIGVDIDDTLSQSTGALIKFHNDNYGTNYKKADLKKYVWEIWADSIKDSAKKIDEFENTDDFLKLKPLDGALEVLKKLKENNELFIITGRSDTNKEKTEQWLSEYFPNIFSKIYYTNQLSLDGKNITKKKICDILDIDILIEDNLPNVLDCSGPKRHAYLLDYPWNQTTKLSEGIKRVHSWKEIGEFLL